MPALVRRAARHVRPRARRWAAHRRDCGSARSGGGRALRSAPTLHQALFANIDHETFLLEVHQYLDERRTRSVTMNRTAGLRRGMPMFDIDASMRVPAAPECLGRMLDVFGQPLNGTPAPPVAEFRDILVAPGGAA